MAAWWTLVLPLLDHLAGRLPRPKVTLPLLRKVASQAADQTEQEMQNRYKAGLVAYTDVVTAQASALSARRALMQVSLNRQTAAINMVAALGGGLSTQQLARD